MKTVISAINYEIGKLVSISELINDSFDPKEIDILAQNGITSFSELSCSLSLSITTCIHRTLIDAQLDGNEIDAVILATESYHELFDGGVDGGSFQEFRAIRDSMFDIVYEAGISKATILSLGYGGCMNFLLAILSAKSLLVQGIAHNVLIILAEKYTQKSSRLMREAISVAGDGVATCLLSNVENMSRLSFEIDYIGITPYQMQPSGSDKTSTLLQMYQSLKHSAADCYDCLRLQPSDYNWLVLGDYNLDTSLLLAKLLGFPPERTAIKNIGLLGHIPFDPLINLVTLFQSANIESTQRILVFLNGPISCGIISVRSVTKGMDRQ